MRFSIAIAFSSFLACLSTAYANPIEARAQRSPPGNVNVTASGTPFKFQYIFTVTAEFRDIIGPVAAPLGGNYYTAPIPAGNFTGPRANGTIAYGAAEKHYSANHSYEETTFTIGGNTTTGVDFTATGTAITTLGVHQSFISIDFNSSEYQDVNNGFILAFSPTAPSERYFIAECYLVWDAVNGGGVV